MGHDSACPSTQRRNIGRANRCGFGFSNFDFRLRATAWNFKIDNRMPRHLEQVLAHAENQLAATGAKRPTEVLPAYKRFLKIEEHRLRLKHQAGGGGREICERRTDLVDVLLRRVFDAATAAVRGNGESGIALALIALGGYGSGELNTFSDIDIMLLHRQ